MLDDKDYWDIQKILNQYRKDRINQDEKCKRCKEKNNRTCE